MLSNDEKLKIELEEKYRAEVIKKLKPKSNTDLLETTIKVVQGIAVVVGILFTYITYHNKSQNEKQETAKEFRKTFYEKQFAFYTEASEAASILATENYQSKDYNAARTQFFRLFWGRLGIIEDITFSAQMTNFDKVLLQYESNPDEDNQYDLKSASLKLAHAASMYTINIWLDSTERKNYPVVANKKLR
ncbi:MAG: hypothetical protein V4592_01385 [Bacteroidota bacterium]